MTQDTIPLCPEVAAVAAAVGFDAQKGQFAIPDEAMAGFAENFSKKLSPKKRQLIGEQLLGLAIKYRRVEKELTRHAEAQITLLVFLVMQDGGEMNAQFAAAFSSLDEKSRKLTGIEPKPSADKKSTKPDAALAPKKSGSKTGFSLSKQRAKSKK